MVINLIQSERKHLLQTGNSVMVRYRLSCTFLNYLAIPGDQVLHLSNQHWQLQYSCVQQITEKFNQELSSTNDSATTSAEFLVRSPAHTPSQTAQAQNPICFLGVQKGDRRNKSILKWPSAFPPDSQECKLQSLL